MKNAQSAEVTSAETPSISLLKEFLCESFCMYEIIAELKTAEN